MGDCDRDTTGVVTGRDESFTILTIAQGNGHCGKRLISNSTGSKVSIVVKNKHISWRKNQNKGSFQDTNY